MTDVITIFIWNRYVVLPSLLKPPALSLNYRYACKLLQARVLRRDIGVSSALSLYGDLMMEGLLTELLPNIEQASGLRVLPTYSYLRIYERGDTLQKHTDRPSCEISLTLCLGYEAPAPWPIWIEGPRGVASISLAAGDALLYRGIECAHWREAFEGKHMIQVFLHYVDQNGPHIEWKFDKRASLTPLRRGLKE